MSTQLIELQGSVSYIKHVCIKLTMPPFLDFCRLILTPSIIILFHSSYYIKKKKKNKTQNKEEWKNKNKQLNIVYHLHLFSSFLLVFKSLNTKEERHLKING